VHIAWLEAVSDPFVATNGVKQGGVLSPVLFCVYIDDLLNLLAESGIGCFMGQYYVGVLAYADDIVLIAPTPTAMRTMLAICDSFAASYDIVFNALKTKCLVIRPSRLRNTAAHTFTPVSNFKINGKDIEFVNTYKHLGHIINNKFTDSDDISERRLSFIGQVNSVLCFFGKQNVLSKQQLFNSYCTSFFGCELWDLTDDTIDELCIAWRKAVKRIWHLPTTTHSYLLPIISQCISPYDLFCSRFLLFISSCLVHESCLISGVVGYGVRYGRAVSPAGRNVLLCLSKYKTRWDDFLTVGLSQATIARLCRQQYGDEKQCMGQFLREAVLLRDGVLGFSVESPFLSSVELSVIIESIATT
jgi:hypothetical protein